MKKVAIIGSRDYPDMEEVRSYIRALSDCEIVSGGARGVDLVAETEARRLGIPVKIFHADWDTYGKRAGAVRNQQIVDYSDHIIAFWDGASKGAKITIDMAEKSKKPLIVISPVEAFDLKTNVEE